MKQVFAACVPKSNSTGYDRLSKYVPGRTYD